MIPTSAVHGADVFDTCARDVASAQGDRLVVAPDRLDALVASFRALRNVSLDSWQIGKIVAAALVLLHVDHGRTT